MIHQQFSKSPVTTVVDLVSIVLNRRIGDHHCHVWRFGMDEKEMTQKRDGMKTSIARQLTTTHVPHHAAYQPQSNQAMNTASSVDISHEYKNGKQQDRCE
nr:hypothetical protein Iba_chr14bCG10460 [Ipomoea batatas]